MTKEEFEAFNYKEADILDIECDLTEYIEENNITNLPLKLRDNYDLFLQLVIAYYPHLFETNFNDKIFCDSKNFGLLSAYIDDMCFYDDTFTKEKPMVLPDALYKKADFFNHFVLDHCIWDNEDLYVDVTPFFTNPETYKLISKLNFANFLNLGNTLIVTKPIVNDKDFYDALMRVEWNLSIDFFAPEFIDTLSSKELKILLLRTGNYMFPLSSRKLDERKIMEKVRKR